LPPLAKSVDDLVRPVGGVEVSGWDMADSSGKAVPPCEEAAGCPPRTSAVSPREPATRKGALKGEVEHVIKNQVGTIGQRNSYGNG